jgi:hypothetical protein
MKTQHIISILEHTPFASLSESDLILIRAHTNLCSDCQQAYEAAQISALLLKERATETFEPSPFFQTRVLAVLRERQTGNEPRALERMWRAAGALVSSMAVTVATLAVLSLVVPSAQSTLGLQNVASVSDAYSAEEVILGQRDLPDDQISEDQVFTTLYGAEEDTVK